MKWLPIWLRPFFRPLLKMTADSKNPTDLELDSLKSHLHFLLPQTLHLIRVVFRAERKRLFQYKWKEMVGYTILTVLVVASSYYSVKLWVEPLIIKVPVTVTKVVYRNEVLPFDSLVRRVSFREASEDYAIVSEHGMLGAFQFSPSTLKAIGISVSQEDFLANRELQVGVFKLLFQKNRKTFSYYINRWSNRSIKNVKGTMTESGILMAFHLKPADAKAFFDSGGEVVGKGDGNGTKVTEYIELFSGYDIPQ